MGEVGQDLTRVGVCQACVMKAIGSVGQGAEGVWLFKMMDHGIPAG